MGKKSRNKNKQFKNAEASMQSSVRLHKPSFILRAKIAILQPTNLILIKFFALMIAFYALWASKFFQENIIKYISIAYAKTGSIVLNILGYKTMTAEDIIRNDVFSISIKNGCDGVEGLAIFLCAVLIFPTKFSNKIKGMFAGAIFLIALNLFRIVNLYIIGIHFPSIFDVMHESVWQVLFIVLSLMALLVFISWDRKNENLKTSIV